MRRILILLIALDALGTQVFADEWDKTLFYPANNGKSAITVNMETGATKLVLEGYLGQRPEKCEAEAFWVPVVSPTIDRLIACTGGTVFILSETPLTATKGAYALVPLLDPKPGDTEEPGPLKTPTSIDPSPAPKANP